MSNFPSEKHVLVTGITGYVASFVALQLLRAGYQVSGSVRSLAKGNRLLETLGEHVPVKGLKLFEADLLVPESWSEAMSGCEAVMHIASPFFAAEPKDPNDLIVPAKQGTLNVLRAATAAGVKRVVLTSSMAAVVYGLDKSPDKPITEQRWTDETHADASSYIRSKTIAEKAAWDYVRQTPNAPELVTICPGVVLGPLLLDHTSDSHLVVSKMLRGELPGMPKFGFELVDVRDIAELHQLALENVAAAGNRYLGVAGLRTFKQIKEVLAKAVPSHKKKLPSFELPDWGIRLFSLVDAETRGVLNELGKIRTATSEKAMKELGWSPRNPNESIAATALDLVRFRRA